MRRTPLRIIAPVVLLAALFITGSATAVVGPAYGRLAFVDEGSMVSCTDGECIVPIVVPWDVTFADQGAFDAVITATVTYRTSPNAKATLRAWFAEDGSSTPIDLSSGPRRLPPTPKWSSVSVSWLVTDLSGAVSYDLSVGVQPTAAAMTGTVLTEWEDVLVTVEAAPQLVTG
jgi:hypothetical protein